MASQALQLCGDLCSSWPCAIAGGGLDGKGHLLGALCGKTWLLAHSREMVTAPLLASLATIARCF